MKTHESKIKKLISELCPNGVLMVSLGEYTLEQTNRNSSQLIKEVRSVTNVSGLVKTSDFFDNIRTSQDTSNYKIVEPGMVVYNPSRINVGSIARHKESIPVIVSPMYVVVSIDTKKIYPEYLDIFLSSTKGKSQILNNVEIGARFRFTYESFSKMKLFLPPILVQKEIVTILTSFADLETELETELEARKKQYEHYRTQLLMLGEGVELKSLGEVCEIADNKRRPVASSLRMAGTTPYYGANNIQDYVEGFTHDGAFVLIAEDGSASLEKYSIQFATGKFWANNHVHVVRGLGLLKNRFLFHFLKNLNFIPFLTGGTRAKLTKSKMLEIKIPLPSLSEQERIVTTLDKFDALVNDISIGLPAELKARRSQYEYYRSKLLTFKEYVN